MIIDKLMVYLQYDFVRYALIVGTLIALCSSLMGVTLVMKNLSFIGDSLSHVAFWAMTIATALKFTNNMVLVLVLTILGAIVILNRGRNTSIKGDSILAMISVGALAIGYLIINVFSKSANMSGDVCSILFGATSILTLKEQDVILCVALSLVVTIMFIALYNRIFAITFDEDFAFATGTKTKIYNLILAVVIAVIIVLAMNLVGSLLISALVIFPALSSMQVFRTFKSVTISSVALSVIGSLTGMIVSIMTSTPVGATIVAIDILIFLSFYAIGKIGGTKA